MLPSPRLPATFFSFKMTSIRQRLHTWAEQTASAMLASIGIPDLTAPRCFAYIPL